MRDDINKAVEVLQQGGLLLYPTDTVWGIGCDATNEVAVNKVYSLKQRTDSKALLVLIDQPGRLSQYIDQVPEVAWELMDVNDKPMTIIYPNAKNLAKNLVASDKSIGIRVTSDPFCQQLIQRFKKPLVSTSANISGNPTPAIFNQIEDEIKHGVDYIVKYRQDDETIAQPSSIIKLGVSGQIEVIRK